MPKRLAAVGPGKIDPDSCARGARQLLSAAIACPEESGDVVKIKLPFITCNALSLAFAYVIYLVDIVSL